MMTHFYLRVLISYSTVSSTPTVCVEEGLASSVVAMKAAGVVKAGVGAKPNDPSIGCNTSVVIQYHQKGILFPSPQALLIVPSALGFHGRRSWDEEERKNGYVITAKARRASMRASRALTKGGGGGV